MSILPDNGLNIEDYTAPQLSPSYGWKLDPSKNKIAGWVDDLDSVAQAIYLMLRTERGKYEIYPDWYGIELNQLYGKPRDLVEVRLPSLVRECLLTDARITSVENFKLEFEGSRCVCRFTVQSIFGEINTEMEYEM